MYYSKILEDCFRFLVILGRGKPRRIAELRYTYTLISCLNSVTIFLIVLLVLIFSIALLSIIFVYNVAFSCL